MVSVRAIFRYMKKICFPATARPHLARQKLLLDELKKHFEVSIFEPTTKPGTMSIFAIMCAIEFNNYLARNEFDAVLIRGDRYEMLGLAMVSAYRGIPIVHLEGGDLSGAIDNKVRHAITDLADYHFATNEEAHSRLINMGVSVDRVWNFGSLDVEYAKSVEPKKVRLGDYILVAYHPIEDEDEDLVKRALEYFLLPKVSVISNRDYGREYGEEQYTSEDYINLMHYASCLVGNSSSFLKEASILGVPVVLVGDRQKKRLLPKNVLNVPCKEKEIVGAIEYQMKRKFEADTIYYKPETSKKVAEKLKEVL